MFCVLRLSFAFARQISDSRIEIVGVENAIQKIWIQNPCVDCVVFNFAWLNSITDTDNRAEQAQVIFECFQTRLYLLNLMNWCLQCFKSQANWMWHIESCSKACWHFIRADINFHVELYLHKQCAFADRSKISDIDYIFFVIMINGTRDSRNIFQFRAICDFFFARAK